MNHYLADPQITFGSLEMLSPVGRPLKFGEPTVRREIRLPESLNERLTKFARANGEDVSDIIRNAVDDRISGKEPKKSPIDSEQIRLALVDVLREQQKDAMPVRLPPPDRELLDGIAKIIGYEESATLVEDVMRNLLRQPEQIQEIVLGPMVRNLQTKLMAEGKADIAKAGSIAKAHTAEKIKALKNDSTKKDEQVTRKAKTA